MKVNKRDVKGKLGLVNKGKKTCLGTPQCRVVEEGKSEDEKQMVCKDEKYGVFQGGIHWSCVV